MDILIFIILLIAGTCIPKVFKWVKFKNKYPILSTNPPSGVMEVGDIVCLGECQYEYMGLNTTNGLWYVFMPENSIIPIYLDKSETIVQITSIYGRYGLKWKRIK